MSIIRPPYTGDPLIDSWTNQITQAINMGLMLPGVQGQSGGEGSSMLLMIWRKHINMREIILFSLI